MSEPQRLALVNRTIPEPEAVRDDVWSLAMPVPGEIVAYTLSVVFAPLNGPAAIIDPGWGSEDALRRVSSFMSSVGRSIDDLATVIVTHSHPDHLGLGTFLRRSTGASLAMHEEEQRSIDSEVADPIYSSERLRAWGVEPERVETLLVQLDEATRQPAPPRADLLLHDDDIVAAGDRSLRVIHSPGHTPGHIGLESVEDGAFFAGDAVLPTVFPGVGLGGDTDGDALADYLTSLRRMVRLDEHEVVPGHGYRFRGLRERRAEASAYMLRRACEVGDVIADHNAADVMQIAARLTWRGGWARVEQSVMLSSALRQTEHYRDFVITGRLEEFGADATDAR